MKNNELERNQEKKRERERERERETDRQIDRPTDQQTNIYIYIKREGGVERERRATTYREGDNKNRMS